MKKLQFILYMLLSLLHYYVVICIQMYKDIDMDYHHVVSHERDLPLPNEYMRVLRENDPDTFNRRKQGHMQEPTTLPQQTNYVNDHDDMHDDGMSEFLDDWFQNTEPVTSQEQFLRDEASTKLYSGCALTRLSSSLLILNLQNRFGWSNVSVTALLS